MKARIFSNQMKQLRLSSLLSILAFVAVAPVLAAQQADAPKAKPEDTEIWAPEPKIVTPGAVSIGAPSDAIVLFDGKGLDEWVTVKDKSPAAWDVANGVMTVNKNGGGNIETKRSFKNYQLHVEWKIPEGITGTSQARGNSGVFLASTGPGDAGYELQVLDSYNNKTYVNGQAGAIYKQSPPLVNPNRKPGEWQTYDIIFEAPKFDGDKVIKPAYFTVIWNGVLVHHHQASMGPMVYRQVAHYQAHAPEESLLLQNHGDKVRYRNIWIRRLGGYDEAEK